MLGEPNQDGGIVAVMSGGYARGVLREWSADDLRALGGRADAGQPRGALPSAA